MNWKHVLIVVRFRDQGVFLVMKSLYLRFPIRDWDVRVLLTSWVMLYVMHESALCLWLCLLRFSEMCSFSKLYTSFTLGPYFWKYYFKIQLTGKWITINEESIRKDHIYSRQYHPHHIPQFAPLPFFYFIMVRIDQSRWSNQTKQVLPSTNLLQATNYTFRCSKKMLCHWLKF